MSLVSHLECARCRNRLEAGRVYNLCQCGSPLLVRYRLSRQAGNNLLERLALRSPDLWRYREVLPVTRDSSIVSLGEGFTPLLHSENLGKNLGFANIYLKTESVNP